VVSGPRGFGILNIERQDLARNRYGWQKSAKELARKERKAEKIRRRQGKTTTSAVEEVPGGIAEETQLSEDQPGDSTPGPVQPDMTHKEQL
jgi:hypothetical protein